MRVTHGMHDKDQQRVVHVVSHMCSTCDTHALHDMCTCATCYVHVCHMSCTCVPHVMYMCAACVPQVMYMCAVCVPHVMCMCAACHVPYVEHVLLCSVHVTLVAKQGLQTKNGDLEHVYLIVCTYVRTYVSSCMHMHMQTELVTSNTWT